MRNPEKVMKVVSIIMLVFSILYALVGGLFVILGILMVAVSNTDGFALQVVESMERTGISIDELIEGVQRINDQFGTDFSIMQIMSLIFVVLLLLGVVMLIYAVTGIVSASLGIKVSKGGKANSAFVWGVILLVCTVIRFGVNFNLTASAILGGLLSFVLPALYVYCAACLKKQGTMNGGNMFG